MLEIREIPGIEHYGISEDGRMWSQKNRNLILDQYKPEPMKTKIKHKYLCVKLHLKGKRHGSDHVVHRLLYLAWVGPIPNGFQIDHLDGNRLNNSISNLQAVTPRENTIRAVKNGLWRSRVGELNPNSNARRKARVVA